MTSAESAGRFVHYHEERGAGLPVLLVHGFGVSSYSWRHLVGPLSKKRRVITVDLKGFGSSPKPCDERYSVHDQADLLCDFIIRHDLRELTLVGHSFGGAVALFTTSQLTEREPGRLARLILVDSIAFKQPLPAFIRRLLIPVVGPVGLYLLPAEVLVRSALALAFYDATKVTGDMVRRYAEALKTPGGRHALLQTARRMVSADTAELASACEKIRVPTLILWGREDRVVPLEVGVRLHETIPRSKLEIIEQCGHMPQEEKPEETLRIIARFMDLFTKEESE